MLRKICITNLSSFVGCGRSSTSKASPLSLVAIAFRNCSSSTQNAPKRFYKDVRIAATGDNSGFEILLDKFKLKTPRRAIVAVPNEQLALAIATEWDSQKDKVHLDQMHLTRLCFSATDNPLNHTKSTLADEMLGYFETDTLFFSQDYPASLKALQDKHWRKWIDWVQKRFQIDPLHYSKTHNRAAAVRNGPSSVNLIDIPELTPTAKEAVRRQLEAQSLWSLFGYQYAVEPLKSLILTLAIMEHQLSVTEAVKISSIERDYQTQQWGRVEWFHDAEHAEISIRVAAGVLFAQLCEVQERKTMSKRITD